MKSVIRKLIAHIPIALIGGVLYYGVELLWRGYSHPAMIIVAGVIFVITGMQDEGSSPPPFWVQVVCGTMLATLLELLAGLVLNVWLGLEIWDYSNMPGNVLGQICPQFMAAWAALLAVAMPLENGLHWILDALRRRRER